MTRLDDASLRAWRLFITANARLIERIDHDMISAGVLPLSWYDVLVELAEAPESRLRLSDLAERVVLSRSGLTRLVDRLEAEGYLRRERLNEDRRGIFAVLTDSGREALRGSWKVYAAAIQEYFAAHLSEDEARVLSGMFERILAALN